MEIQAKIFDKNISLCPLPLNTNLNYVNASDKNQQNSVFNLTRKRPESKALNLCMWVVGWIGNLGDARIFATRHISSQFEEKNLCWIISFLFELEARSDLIVIRIN